jgi:alpha-1,6-mannosyltransferase
VNLALYLTLDLDPQTAKPPPRRAYAAISLLTFSAVIFRSEVLVLLAPLSIQYLSLGYTTLSDTIRVGLISGLTSLGLCVIKHIFQSTHSKISAITVCLDSYFWGQWPLWPEFVGLYFNVYQGKSSEWGVRYSNSYYAITESHLSTRFRRRMHTSLLIYRSSSWALYHFHCLAPCSTPKYAPCSSHLSLSLL